MSTTNAAPTPDFAVAPDSATFTTDDLAILGQVDVAIQYGHEILDWWTANRDTRVRADSFPIARQIHQPDLNYGFLLDAHLKSGTLPVAGVVQDQLIRWPKLPPDCPRDPEWMRAQLRAFIFEHFMRLTGTRPLSEAAPLGGDDAGTSGPGTDDRLGWGYRQKFYRLADGTIGKFTPEQQTSLIALDEIFPTYLWIIYEVRIHQFDMSFQLPGSANGTSVNASSMQPVHTVLTPRFLVDEQHASPGIVGEYGYGYSVVPNPVGDPIVTGPATIEKTIETLTFRVLDDGSVRAHMNFITPQPAHIINRDPVQMAFALADHLSFNTASTALAPLKAVLEGMMPQTDPVFLSIDVLSALTMGVSSNVLGINKDTIFKTFMNLHFTDVFKMYNLAASHFTMVRDWTDAAALPAWTMRGVRTPPGSVQS